MQCVARGASLKLYNYDFHSTKIDISSKKLVPHKWYFVESMDICDKVNVRTFAKKLTKMGISDILIWIDTGSTWDKMMPDASVFGDPIFNAISLNFFQMSYKENFDFRTILY